VAIVVRFAWVYAALYLPRKLSDALRRSEAAPPEAEFFIISWCGMRPRSPPRRCASFRVRCGT